MDIKITKGTIEHNGKIHTVGAEIKQMKKEDGERLIKLGRAEELTKESKKKGSEDKGAGAGTGDDTGKGDGTPAPSKDGSPTTEDDPEK